MTEYRCKKCNRMLLKAEELRNSSVYLFQVKCPKCKTTNTFVHLLKDLELLETINF